MGNAFGLFVLDRDQDHFTAYESADKRFPGTEVTAITSAIPSTVSSPDFQSRSNRRQASANALKGPAPHLFELTVLCGRLPSG